MISLAVADKPLVRELCAAHELDMDYLETSGPLVESAVAALSTPMLLHNSLWDWSLAHPAALEQSSALKVTHKALELTRAPWLSVHLGFSAALVEFDHGMQIRSDLMMRQTVLDNICRNLMELASMISVPVIIENLDYNIGGAYEYICEPEFIADVLGRTGVGMLLDIAHARVSAARLGYSIANYLKVLPLECVMEIHVSGPRWQGKTLVDVHDTLLDEDYMILQDVLLKTSPAAITLEFARDKQALISQVAQLRKLIV